MIDEIRRLPVDQRILVGLRYHQQMTDSEIAGEVDIPVGTVKSRIASTGAVEPVEYSCFDPLGEDPTGRQLYGSCDPRPGDLDGDDACTDRIGSDNGFVRFSWCEPVGQLGPLPDPDGDAPFDTPDDLPVRATTSGDTSRSRVADTEGYSAFYPGLEIVVPPSWSDGC